MNQKNPKDLVIKQGTYSEDQVKGGQSIKALIERTMNDNGYPVKTCQTFCEPANLCATLEEYGCDVGGGDPLGARNGLSIDSGDTILGGPLTQDTVVNGGGQHNMAFNNVENFQVTTAATPPGSTSTFTMGSSQSNGFLLRHNLAATPAKLSELSINWNGSNVLRQTDGSDGVFYTQQGAQSGQPRHDFSVVEGANGRSMSIGLDGIFMNQPNPSSGQDKVLLYDQFSNEVVFGDPIVVPALVENGLEVDTDKIGLGGTLVRDTTINTSNLRFAVSRGDVRLRVDPQPGTSGADDPAFLSFGSGKCAYFFGKDPANQIFARGGVFSTSGGTPPRFAASVINGTTGIFQTVDMSPVIDKMTLKVSTDAPDENFHQILASDEAAMGYSNNPLTEQVEFVVIKIASGPDAGVWHMLRGAKSFADDTAAAAAAPSGTIWRDPNNFLKIVP
jgi:hypothetical protein